MFRARRDSTPGPSSPRFDARTVPLQPERTATPPTMSHALPTARPHILSQTTLRAPPWTYIDLQHMGGGAGELDALTAHLHLTAALTRFHGLHGAAVSFDVLEVRGAGVRVRVPRGDWRKVVAAAAGWTGAGGEGWRVVGWSAWGVGKGGGGDLFE